MPRQKVGTRKRDRRKSLNLTFNSIPTMLRRLIYEDWQLIFPVMALITATTVYLAAAWRAAHMRPQQADELARLPLDHD